MKIEHVALWVSDLELMRDFYHTFFQASANTKYVNEKKGFESYFLQFKSGARLEIMRQKAMANIDADDRPQRLGYCHLAFSLGGKAQVDALTRELDAAGFRVVDGPRTTGDGYYESVVLDPEGNRLELTE